jgi:hypothetical protein
LAVFDKLFSAIIAIILCSLSHQAYTGMQNKQIIKIAVNLSIDGALYD